MLRPAGTCSFSRPASLLLAAARRAGPRTVGGWPSSRRTTPARRARPGAPAARRGRRGRRARPRRPSRSGSSAIAATPRPSVVLVDDDHLAAGGRRRSSAIASAIGLRVSTTIRPCTCVVGPGLLALRRHGPRLAREFSSEHSCIQYRFVRHCSHGTRDQPPQELRLEPSAGDGGGDEAVGDRRRHPSVRRERLDRHRHARRRQGRGGLGRDRLRHGRIEVPAPDPRSRRRGGR